MPRAKKSPNSPARNGANLGFEATLWQAAVKLRGGEFTLEGPNDAHARSIGDFAAEVEKEGERGWTAFDPHDVMAKQILQ
jgi:hypothetical protein